MTVLISWLILNNNTVTGQCLLDGLVCNGLIAETTKITDKLLQFTFA